MSPPSRADSSLADHGRWVFALVLLVLSGLLAGCAAKTFFNRQGRPENMPREADCEVEVAHLPVEGTYFVLGVIDIDAFYPGAMPEDDEAFLEAVREDACQAGGEAVIPVITGVPRHYVQAVVITRSEPVPPPPDEEEEEEGDDEEEPEESAEGTGSAAAPGDEAESLEQPEPEPTEPYGPESHRTCPGTSREVHSC